MAKFAECKVWVLLDSCGDYVAHSDPKLLVQEYESFIQPVADSEGFRRVCITVKVPIPEVIELSCEVECEERSGVLELADSNFAKLLRPEELDETAK